MCIVMFTWQKLVCEFEVSVGITLHMSYKAVVMLVLFTAQHDSARRLF